MSDDALAFALTEYHGRLRRVREEMARARVDVLVVTAPENICYLTGFATTGYHVFQALVVPVANEPWLVLRNIEVSNAHQHSWITDVAVISDLDSAHDTLLDTLARVAPDSTVGYDHLTTWLPPLAVESLRAQFGAARVIPAGGLVEAARAIKSPAELELIAQAASIADAAFAAGARAVRDAATDSDVAAAVHAELARQGSGYTGSPAYVVGGAASASSHATHDRRPIDAGSPVWMEIPASVQRYHACVSRTVAQEGVAQELARAFEAASRAVGAMVDAARDGVTTGELDAIGRAVVDDHGWGSRWTNRSAYSLGLSFPPGLGEGHIIDLKPGDRRIVRENMVFHVIPILKLPGLGAAGCTETVVVGKDGGRSLTSLPRSTDARAYGRAS
ncbi:M24 family metallopeptidase [Microbacterium sp. SSM24]|uniref:M24 family metallopeptidase n=1 Tax=Microbacterium sp. SSM24 TaxID=2991714 RepID=UPI002227716A|nr:Xaa-Pro peptidase family protein [Microbacterium sp. SSM24]MCW3493366.1 Xaa-Pro peptidase family protein [Microbacterium sp. SSM24]